MDDETLAKDTKSRSEIARAQRTLFALGAELRMAFVEGLIPTSEGAVERSTIVDFYSRTSIEFFDGGRHPTYQPDQKYQPDR